MKGIFSFLSSRKSSTVPAHKYQGHPIFYAEEDTPVIATIYADCLPANSHPSFILLQIASVNFIQTTFTGFLFTLEIIIPAHFALHGFQNPYII